MFTAVHFLIFSKHHVDQTKMYEGPQSAISEEEMGQPGHRCLGRMKWGFLWERRPSTTLPPLLVSGPGECSSLGTNQNGGSQAMVRGLCWEWWTAVLRGNWTSISYSSSGYWEVCSMPCLISGKWWCWRMSGWNWLKAWRSGGGGAVTPPLWPHSPVWWASLVAQLLKNPPAMRETWVGSLGWEGNSYPLQYSGHGEVHGVTESDTTEWLSLLSDFCGGCP